jgi:hypothetical protein
MFIFLHKEVVSGFDVPPEVKCHIVERKSELHSTMWRHLPEKTQRHANGCLTEDLAPIQGFNRRNPQNNISKVKIPNTALSTWFKHYAALQQCTNPAVYGSQKASHQFSRSIFGRMMVINTQE